MIKFLYIIPTLFIAISCTSINPQSLKELGNFFKPNESIQTKILELSDDDDLMIYSFNNSKYEILKLSYQANSLKEWKTSNGEIFYKDFRGKFIQSYNQGNNFHIIYNDEFEQNLFIDGSKIKTQISFDNPKSGLLDIYYEYKLLKKYSIKLNNFANQEIGVNLIEETFNVPKIYWRGTNYYWINDELGVIKSKQIISPNKDKLHLEIVKTAN
tara:strand:+ start:6279 stop:6917 length:639 start_codon:yes stop_codon:yes gene_type:complete